jgi:hypothetical protein
MRILIGFRQREINRNTFGPELGGSAGPLVP